MLGAELCQQRAPFSLRASAPSRPPDGRQQATPSLLNPAAAGWGGTHVQHLFIPYRRIYRQLLIKETGLVAHTAVGFCMILILFPKLVLRPEQKGPQHHPQAFSSSIHF